MNNMTKMTLAAVFTAAVATSARAQYVNGDILVGFTTTDGSGTEFIENLGLATALTTGETWSISTSDTQFGVIGGSTDGNTYYITSLKNGVGTRGAYTGAASSGTALQGFAQVFATQNGIGGAGSIVTPAASSTYSWFNFVTKPSGFSGGSSWATAAGQNADVDTSKPAYFFSVAQTGAGTVDSDFTYSSGTLTYVGPNNLTSSVPEPATYGLLAGLGLLALSIRRQFAKA